MRFAQTLFLCMFCVFLVVQSMPTCDWRKNRSFRFFVAVVIAFVPKTYLAPSFFNYSNVLRLFVGDTIIFTPPLPPLPPRQTRQINTEAIFRVRRHFPGSLATAQRLLGVRDPFLAGTVRAGLARAVPWPGRRAQHLRRRPPFTVANGRRGERRPRFVGNVDSSDNSDSGDGRSSGPGHV